ncbi:SusC/RagA family TonB-linked outer membrane protein [Arcticibacter svalbardensis]|nr:TonB-dependent receptor [Arcticibacter svalbardensis]
MSTNVIGNLSSNSVWVRVRLLFSIIFLLSMLFSFKLYAQTPTKITGVIKDAIGVTLPGVTVKVKGAQNTTQSDLNGAFTISVQDKSATLVFTYVGFATNEVKVGDKSTLNIVLQESVNDLNEVVVTGYGQTAQRKNLTGSQSSVTEKDIEERQPVTLFDALQGQASGVSVVNDNGDPFGQGTIQIRGASSVNATGVGPLYVIDGIISEDANFVSPQDIASIEILKDVASASIYGARGANGVILITTKRGKEGKPTLGLQYTYTLGELSHKIRTTSADDLRYYRRVRGGDTGFGGNVDSVNPYLNADNDFQDLLFRTSKKQIVNLSLSGGQKGMTYYAGLNYLDNQALIINSYAKRIQSKINVTFELSPKLTISNNLGFAYQTGNVINIGNSAKQVFERNPWTSLYAPDGSLSTYSESKRNPVAYALLDKNVDNDYLTQFNTQLKYKIYKDLTFTTQLNAQVSNDNNREVTPGYLNSSSTNISIGTGSTERKVYWETQGFFNYNKTINEDHVISGVLGLTADRRRKDTYEFRATDLLSDEIFTSNIGTLDPLKTGTSATANSNASIFSRLSYSYKGKYIVQGSVRRDGSSRFGENNKYGNFFSGSALWRFSEEKFMNFANGVLDDGKLRFSIGSAGNDAIGDYLSYTVMNFGGNYYNGYLGAAENSTLGNSLIKWETSTSSNFGLDLTFLKGRLSFTAEYYDKTTKNLLYSAELSKETGKSQVAINLGTIQNKGLEFTVLGSPVANKDFGWNINANITFPQGKIKKLADGTSFITGSKWLVQEGGKIGDFYLLINKGVYQYDVSNAYTPDNQKLMPVDVVVSDDKKTVVSVGGYTLNGQPYTGTITKKYYNGVLLQGGDTEWQDTDNNGSIDDEDKVIAGNGLPKYYFGFGNTFRYKKISIDFLFNAQFGNDIYNTVANSQNSLGSTYTPPIWDAATTSWSRQGDITKFPNAVMKDTRGSIRAGYNSMYLEDGSFIRLASARFTYALDSKVIKKVGIKGANVYVYGQNLVTWTNYSWYDPEFSTSNQLQPGNDTGRYPKVREFGLGLNITL